MNVHHVLITAALFSLSAAAAAQTVTMATESGDTETVQTTEAAATSQPARTCLRSTGSRVVTAQNLKAEKEGKPQRCANSAGRVYTSEDLDRSGHMNIAEALRSLDTSIR